MARKRKDDPATARPPSAGDEIEWWPIDVIKPYDRNSRTHTTEQIDAIARSFKQFGWTQPALVQEDGTLIAGHARVEAAKRLGWLQAKVLVARGWTKSQIRAYVIADNKLAEKAGWAEDVLRAEMAALRADDFDLSSLGFDDREIEKMFEAAMPPDEFRSVDESLETEHHCPKCGYRWSGKAGGSAAEE